MPNTIKKIIIPEKHFYNNEILLNDVLDLPNPHAILAKNPDDVVGLVCRHPIIDNVWIINWNSGIKSSQFPSVKELIIACYEAGIIFYFIKL